MHLHLLIATLLLLLAPLAVDLLGRSVHCPIAAVLRLVSVVVVVVLVLHIARAALLRRRPHHCVAFALLALRLQLVLQGAAFLQVLLGLAIGIEAGAFDKVLGDAERLAQLGILHLLRLGDLVSLANAAEQWVGFEYLESTVIDCILSEIS